jgi:hypothetical protein
MARKFSCPAQVIANAIRRVPDIIGAASTSLVLSRYDGTSVRWSILINDVSDSVYKERLQDIMRKTYSFPLGMYVFIHVVCTRTDGSCTVLVYAAISYNGGVSQYIYVRTQNGY